MKLSDGAGAVGVEFALDLEAASSSVGPARRSVDAWLRARGHGSRSRRSVTLVVSELVTNALQASPGSTLGLRVTDDVERGVVQIAVSNPISGQAGLPDRSDWGPESPDAPRGRGLEIVASLASRVKERRGADRLWVLAEVPMFSTGGDS